MSVKKIVFVGCSFTSGAGWNSIDHSTSQPNHPNLWVNLCHQRIEHFKKLNLHNKGITGASNFKIFEQTIDAIAEFGNSIDTLICQWTSYPRYNVNTDFEICNKDNTTYSKEYIRDLIQRLQILQHPHWGILDVVKLTNVVKKISTRIGIKNVHFVNGLCHWDRGYFDKLENTSPENYTTYTKHQVLNINNRNNEDSLKLYNIAHNQYCNAGGINSEDWINLYDSFQYHQVDYNFDNSHPGTKSNENFFNLVNAFFKNK